MGVKSILSSAIVISILLIQPTSAAPPRYEIIDLGGEEAYSINEEGEVVGRAFYHAMPQGVHHAVLFDTTGGGNNIDLGTLAEGTHSCAWSINNRSQIVGYASTYGIHSMHATLFDSSGNGNNTDFLTLGGMESAARSINDDGQIIGYATNNLNMERATLFDPSGSGENIDLGTLGGDVSEAMSINNNGQIVGWAMDGLGFKIATIFDPTGNGDNLDLGTLGGNYSFALSINDKGQIVGSADIASGDTHATLFDTSGNGNNVDLGTLGGNSSAALSINNKAEIVGISRTTYSYYKHAYHATLFDPSGNGNNIDLNALIDPNSGWILKEALSINDYRWIVGVGYNPEGRATACLLIPKPPKIIYVDDDANGANDGSSWDDAYNYLQDALAAAWSGDEIRVAQGIYTPDSNSANPNGSGVRTTTFQLINGVTLKGGYAGAGAPEPDKRDIELYETILSGDLEGNDVEIEDFEWVTIYDFTSHPSRAENSCHIVTGSGTDATTVLDGVTITGGNAYGPEPGYCDDNDNSLTYGAGMYNDSGSPTLVNCTFYRNTSWTIYAYSCPENTFDTGILDFDMSSGSVDFFMPETSGAGIYNLNSSMTLRNCTFEENMAFGADSASAGGGIHNINSDVVMINCIFKTNVATGFDNEYWGGAIANSNSNPTLVDCSFIGNLAYYGSGGALTLSSGTSATLTNCTFAGNVAEDGGAISGLGQATLTNCAFHENVATSYGSGGAIFTVSGNPTLVNCTFSRNSANKGGSIFHKSGATLINCVFTENSAGAGAGIFSPSHYGTLIVRDCTFSANKAEGWGGGGMYNGSDGNSIVTNCVFIANSSERHGGGMHNWRSNTTITNCTFTANSAVDNGGGIFNEDGSPALTNCTFIENSAYVGAGMSNEESNPVLVNCKFVGNRGGRGDGIYNIRSSPDLNNCYFIDNWLGMGNYDGSNSKLTNCAFTANFTGIDGYGSIVTLKNCAFSGNKYGTFFDYSKSNLKLMNCTFSGHKSLVGVDGGAVTTLTNCIVWGNDSLQYDYDGIVIINYSCIQGGFTGIGNIDTDPCFVELGYWDANGTPDDANDDFWIDGDYHLLEDSPCIDTGDPNYVAEPNETDLDGKPRIINDRIDMGAYEYSPPIQANVRIVPRTINLASSGQWITAFVRLPEDYSVADIDPNSVLLENEIEPERFWLSEDNQIALIKFDREQVQNILSIGKIGLTITGQMTDGTVFEGADIIKVIDKTGKKSVKRR